MLLGREDILHSKDLKFEEVDVPEWGGTVRVRVMTGSERDAFEQSIISQNTKDSNKNMVNLRAKLVARTVCDDNNKRIFTDSDISLLGEKSAGALDRVFEVAQRLNRLGAKDVDNLAKNSESEEKGGSISLSPEN
jgi:hypothetical protein